MESLTANAHRCFVAPSWLRAILVVGALAACSGASVLIHQNGLSTGSGVLGALAVLILAGLADSLLCRVVLYPDRLVIVSNFRKREYQRMQFNRATWSKGVPVALELVEGGWVKLPDFVTGGPGVLSIFRAWLQGAQNAA
jgi:hypothetical protein